MAEIEDIMPILDFEAEVSGSDDDFDLQDMIKRSIEEAVAHFEDNIEPDMAEATDYYHGRPFGDEQTGRSKVVSTDLRDATLDQIPDLIEIFMGSDSVVEFRPKGPEDVAGAEQATDMVNHVFYEENEGFLILNSILKDAGVRRLGYVKWWWEDQVRIKGYSLTGVTEQELMLLSQEPGVQYEITGEGQDFAQKQNPETGEVEMVPIPTFDCEVSHSDLDGRARVEEVPPEEIVWTPEARKFSRAPLIAHTREVPFDELLLMGIPEEFIEDHRGIRDSRAEDSLSWSRQFYGSSSTNLLQDNKALDPSQRPVLFTEAYALVDVDGDGVGELRCFQCVGPGYEIVPDEDGSIAGELVDQVPIAVFTPDPEPHTIPGLCNFDYLKEIQKVKSQIQRGQLNSLSQSIENQLVVASSEVNMRDIISPEISGIIRVRRDVNNSIREIKHQFVGGDTLPVLEYYDQIRRDRTGRPGPQEGMDPNILQSTSAEGVGAVLSKSQARIKMIARVYAETGFKALFHGLYKLLIENQSRSKMIRLRGEFVQVDPRSWNSEMDVRVNVALGTGSRGEKLASLQQLAAKQEEHIASGSPLVSFAELRATYGKLTDLLGYKDTEQFFKQWGPEQQQQFDEAQAEAAKNAPEDPAVLIAKVEQLKVQLRSIESTQKHDLESMKIQLEDQRERDRMAREFTLREYEMELQYKSKIEDREMQAKVAQSKAVDAAD